MHIDEKVGNVVLVEPPATHDTPSHPDGSGDANELLGVLRFTDITVTAGLLWPAELVFVFIRPPAYAWAEEVYSRLGSPGRITHIRDFSTWRPA